MAASYTAAYAAATSSGVFAVAGAFAWEVAEVVVAAGVEDFDFADPAAPVESSRHRPHQAVLKGRSGWDSGCTSCSDPAVAAGEVDAAEVAVAAAAVATCMRIRCALDRASEVAIDHIHP